MAISITEHSFLRLLQLSSASLPVGGYSFSNGLEYAIDSGWLTDKDDVAAWIKTQLGHGLAQLDIPVVKRIVKTLEQKSDENLAIVRVLYWNNYLIASRETRELRLTDVAMGQALQRLLNSLEIPTPFSNENEVSFVAAFALAAHYWGSDSESAALAFVWSWLEAQVAAATKLVPLGQTQAQQLLGEIQQYVPTALAQADNIKDEELGASLPGLAMASMLHETQYSRLFRS